MKKSTKENAIFPGSFDPFHEGHKFIIDSALDKFEKIYIVISWSENKERNQTFLDSKKQIEKIYKSNPKIEIIINKSEMMTNVAKKLNCFNIVRGIRNNEDEQYEDWLKNQYQQLEPRIKVFYYSNKKLQNISSTKIKNNKNKIGLIIADNNEIQKMNEFKLIKKHESIFDVWEYEFNKKTIFVIHSRIGLVNAAMATQFLIDNFKVNQIWNYGAVGSLKKFKLYDVAIPTKFYYFDAHTPWYKRGQIPGEEEYFKNDLISNYQEDINIGSGNAFIEDAKYFKKFENELNLHLIDMESCAIAHTCQKNKIKFYCIKAVSDEIGKSNTDKKEINKVIAKSSFLAFNKMIEYLKKL